MMATERLHYLFRQYVEKSATPEETTELMAWLSENASDNDILSLMDNAWEDFTSARQVFDTEKSNRMLQQALAAVPAATPVMYPITGRKRWRIPAAAAAILLLIFGSYLLLRKEAVHSPVQQTIPVAKSGNDIAPANGKIMLTIANGAPIALEDIPNGQIPGQGTGTAVKQNGQLLYAPSTGKSEAAAVYNTITTARGKQYMVVLSDGTRVWLNTASSLRFPAVFNDTIRKVELSGEGYFEVAPAYFATARNKRIPFIVTTVPPAGGRAAEIAVLGTHFNIKAYNDEALIKTTLLEGSVRISAAKSSTTKDRVAALLTPGQQARLSNLSAHNNASPADRDIQLVKDINIRQTMAWKNELFDFENESIQDIMQQLSRWYDIEVEFKGTIPEKHYYGAIRRQVNISEVFKMLEIAGNVTFTIQGKKVYIQQKK